MYTDNGQFIGQSPQTKACFSSVSVQCYPSKHHDFTGVL